MEPLKNLKIAPIELEDAAAVITYINTIGGESDNLTFGAEGNGLTLELEESFIKEWKTNDRSLVLLAQIDGEVISMGSLINLHKKARLHHRASLSLTVKKAYWDCGIGTKMMEALLSFARKDGGYEVIQLEVMMENLRAVHLYQKFGFHSIGVYERFMKIGDRSIDACLMNLYL